MENESIEVVVRAKRSHPSSEDGLDIIQKVLCSVSGTL